MKKLFSIMQRNKSLLAAFVLISFILSACKKDLNTGTNQPAAGLMAVNLVPDKDGVGVSLSNNNFTNSPLNYTNYTGGYNAVYIGNRDVVSYDFYSGTPLASKTQLFEDSSYYSLFIVGANDKYSNVIVKDNLDSLPSGTGEAYVRYINAIPDTTIQPLVTISSNGTDVFNSNAPFTTVSDFKGVTPGDVSIAVDNGDSTVNASRNITLEGGKIYTVLLFGMPGATDTTKAVQIKYILNGTVTP